MLRMHSHVLRMIATVQRHVSPKCSQVLRLLHQSGCRRGGRRQRKLGARVGRWPHHDARHSAAAAICAIYTATRAFAHAVYVAVTLAASASPHSPPASAVQSEPYASSCNREIAGSRSDNMAVFALLYTGCMRICFMRRALPAWRKSC